MNRPVKTFAPADPRGDDASGEFATLHLKLGDVFSPAREAKGPSGLAPFTVTTRNAVVTATGTVFTVRCLAAGAATVVTVQEGKVLVHGLGVASRSSFTGERAVVRINFASLEPPNAETGPSAPRVP